MTVSVRPLETRDERHWRQLWAGYQVFYGVDLPEETTAETWARLLDPDAPYGGFVAALPGLGVVGMANYVLHPDTWSSRPYCYLNDLYVEGSARRRGVARALVRAVRARAEELGCPVLWWITAQDNERARTLYDQMARLDPFVRYEIPLE